MTEMNLESISDVELQDYSAIKEYVPEAKPKQVKWLKEMLDMGRQLGIPEPVGEIILKGGYGKIDPPFRLQALAGFKSSFALELKKRRKPTLYETTGQMDLFHPESFSKGDSQTLREMQGK